MKTFEDYEKQERERIERNLCYAEAGVRFIDIKQAYIDEGVTIGKGTVIYPCVVLEGNVDIGENCVIGQNSKIVDSIIGDETSVQSSVILESKVGCGTNVGPFAYIRPHCSIGNECKVGDFVEIKNSSMDDGTKAAHLTYIGDSDIGANVNFGCGVVFVNFNGKEKFRSIIGDEAFIGCNTNIISPVNVGEKSYIAAGSTVTCNVPDGALYVDRNNAKILEGWVEKRDILNRKK